MRRMNFVGKKTMIALGLCVGIAGFLFVSQKPSVAAATGSRTSNDTIISFSACENNDEEVLYEDVDEAISLKVIDFEDQGTEYDVSDPIELEDAYYHRIQTEDGESVIAGITAGDQNYVVTMESNKGISDKEVEQAIADLQEELQ